MEGLQYVVNARDKLHQIKSKQMSARGRILLLQTLKNQVKQALAAQNTPVADNSKFECTTFISESNSPRASYRRQEQEAMIQKILCKQQIKIQMDQEIDTCQDDLLQIEKIVETKQAYTEQLTAKIAQTLKKINEEEQKKKNSNILKKVKSSPSFLKKLFG